MNPAHPAIRVTFDVKVTKRFAQLADTSNRAASPRAWTFLDLNHWHFINLGQGTHGTSPYLAGLFQDTLELGDRVAMFLDGEAIGDWP
jgi:hypothetical protein